MKKQTVQLLLHDVGYVVFFSLFFTNTAFFQTSEAPQQLSRVSQVMYFDLSRQFRPSVNGAAWLAQLSFVLFGLSKVAFGFTHQRVLRYLYFAQGGCGALLALVNDDVSSPVHASFATTVVVSSMVIVWLKVGERSWSDGSKAVVKRVLVSCYTLEGAVAFFFVLDTLEVKPLVGCGGLLCDAAPALSMGYYEWCILGLVFAADIAAGSTCVEYFRSRNSRYDAIQKAQVSQEGNSML